MYRLSVFTEKNCVFATYELILKSTEIPNGDVVLDGHDGTVVRKPECRDTRKKTDRLGGCRYDMY